MQLTISQDFRRRRSYRKKFLKNTDHGKPLANTDKLKGKMKENIEANKEKVSYLKL
jgi:hypothetical protein